MRKHRISDEDASVVLRGQTPEARPDLASLADSIAVLRMTCSDAPPKPSAELAQRLDLERADRVSASAFGLSRHSHEEQAAAVPQPAPRIRGARMLISGFLGLGLAAKIALGATAAAAVGISGAGVAGAAGVLPPAAQQAFDQVTGKEASEVEATEDETTELDGVEGTEEVPTGTETAGPVHPGKNASETGVENSRFGQETAEEARQRGEQAREGGDEASEGDTEEGAEDGAGETDAEEAAENAGTRPGNGGKKGSSD